MSAFLFYLGPYDVTHSTPNTSTSGYVTTIENQNADRVGNAVSCVPASSPAVARPDSARGQIRLVSITAIVFDSNTGEAFSKVALQGLRVLYVPEEFENTETLHDGTSASLADSSRESESTVMLHKALTLNPAKRLNLIRSRSPRTW